MQVLSAQIRSSLKVLGDLPVTWGFCPEIVSADLSTTYSWSVAGPSGPDFELLTHGWHRRKHTLILPPVVTFPVFDDRGETGKGAEKEFYDPENRCSRDPGKPA